MIKTGSSPVLSLAIAAACALMLSCKQEPLRPVEGVVVTVNGAPITSTDILVNSRNIPRGHQTAGAVPDNSEILEDIILQELAYQRALELGLDADPDYQQDLSRLEAQVNAFKRRALSEAFFKQELSRKTEVSDAEVQRYFDENGAILRTELHVWMVLRRDEDQIRQIQSELNQGQSFEEVAARQFPEMPGMDRQPWDLGYLRWSQVPEAWKEVLYKLQTGETSDIIRGPKNRFWIVKLIDKRENPDITFEQLKPAIVDLLGNEKRGLLRDETIRSLRDKARIVYSR